MIISAQHDKSTIHIFYALIMYTSCSRGWYDQNPDYLKIIIVKLTCIISRDIAGRYQSMKPIIGKSIDQSMTNR